MNAQDYLFSSPQVAPTSDDWYTPQWIFDKLDVRFTMDVSAPPGGLPWIPADRHLTKAEDGLLVPWEGRIWMNPPFSKMTPWVKKFMDHRQGVALLPAGRSKWFETLWESDAFYVCLPTSLTFKRPSGKVMPMAFGAYLVTFEDELVENLGRIGRVR